MDKRVVHKTTYAYISDLNLDNLRSKKMKNPQRLSTPIAKCNEFINGLNDQLKFSYHWNRVTCMSCLKKRNKKI